MFFDVFNRNCTDINKCSLFKLRLSFAKAVQPVSRMTADHKQSDDKMSSST